MTDLCDVGLDVSDLMWGNNPIVWAEGCLPGASALVWLEVFVDDESIGADEVRVLIEPVQVATNTETVRAILVGDGVDPSFIQSALDENDFIVCAQFDGQLWPQDTFEICKRPETLATDDPPTAFFYELVSGSASNMIDDRFGLFSIAGSKNEGGNIEALPPTENNPYGPVLLGDTISPSILKFFEMQKIQCVDGAPVVLPVEWLKVAHVDEVVSVVPTPNGYRVLVPDINLGIQILAENDGLVEPDAADNFPTKAFLLSQCTNQNAAVRIGLISNSLDRICSILSDTAGVPTNQILRIPILFNLPVPSGSFANQNTNRWASPALPNMTNLLAVKGQTGSIRLFVPDPHYRPFRAYLEERLVHAGLNLDDIIFTDTSALHDVGGEIHCGTNAYRQN